MERGRYVIENTTLGFLTDTFSYAFVTRDFVVVVIEGFHTFIASITYIQLDSFYSRAFIHTPTNVKGPLYGCKSNLLP